MNRCNELSGVVNKGSDIEPTIREALATEVRLHQHESATRTQQSPRPAANPVREVILVGPAENDDRVDRSRFFPQAARVVLLNPTSFFGNLYIDPLVD
ncbi:MAG: hypothetical protein OXH68_16720 [Gammaproteobacteria bacterium]|nr:hypothetical protein [Gammaproteobacteria bacterium]